MSHMFQCEWCALLSNLFSGRLCVHCVANDWGAGSCLYVQSLPAMCACECVSVWLCIISSNKRCSPRDCGCCCYVIQSQPLGTYAHQSKPRTAALVCLSLLMQLVHTHVECSSSPWRGNGLIFVRPCATLMDAAASDCNTFMWLLVDE